MLLGFSKTQSVEIMKQLINLVWQQSQPSQTTFNLFQKPIRAKQPVDLTKQQVVFALVRKTSISKMVLIHISFRFNKGVDYTLIYPDPTHPPTHNNNSSLSPNTLDLNSSKLLITFDQHHNPLCRLALISKMPSCFDGQRLIVKTLWMYCRKWVFLH